MASRQRGALIRDVQTLFNVGTVGCLTDRQLLDRFRAQGGEAAELAFAALVERHGPMVLRACRGILRDPHEVHDAFQATFLVLLRRAGSLWVGDSLGAWLHQVARRMSCAARTAAVRRRKHERRAAERAPRLVVEAGPDDLAERLDEEVARLPARFREAVVLCLLEGLTHEQAAGRLGWPVGTLQSRLARGRQRLRLRLIRQGLAPAGGVLAVLLAGTAARAAPPVPPALAEATIDAAIRFAAGGRSATAAAAGIVPASVITLMEGVLTAMFMTRIKMFAAALLAIGGMATGVAVVGQQPSTPEEVPGPIYTAVSAEKILLSGPAPGQQLEIKVVKPGAEDQTWTVKTDQPGRLVVTRESRAGDGRTVQRQEVTCSALEVRAPRGTQDDIVFSAIGSGTYRVTRPKRESPPLADTPGVVEKLIGGVKFEDVGKKPEPSPSADFGSRLADVERKLDRILEAMERDARPRSPNGSSGEAEPRSRGR